MFSLFRRPQQIKSSLTKTRASFLTRLSALVAKSEVNEEFWSGLEETLIGADVGVETTIALVDKLRVRAEKERVRDAARVQELLKEELLALDLNTMTPMDALWKLNELVKIAGKR